MPEVERFEDYALTATVHSHHVEFDVKHVAGETLSPEPAGIVLYELAGAPSTAQTTVVFEDGEPFLNGDVKWDGCSNWNFHTDSIMAHFCGRDQAVGVGRLLDHLYKITEERLETFRSGG